MEPAPSTPSTSTPPLSEDEEPRVPIQALKHTVSTAVNLGDIRVTVATSATGHIATEITQGLHKKPSLRVASTIILGLPPGTSFLSNTEEAYTSTAPGVSMPSEEVLKFTKDELWEAVKKGDVVLIKAGSCEISFVAMIDGVSVAPVADQEDNTTAGHEGTRTVNRTAMCRRFLAIMESSLLWQDVGLVLKRKHVGGQAGIEGDRVSYFLHHPDLAAEMVKMVPDRVPVVEFRGLRVVLDFCSGMRKGVIGRKRKGKELGKGKRKGRAMFTERGASSAEETHGYGLRREPRSTAKALEAWRDVAAEHDDGVEEEPPPNFQWSESEMESLVDVGLRRLLGIGRGPRGFRTTRSEPSPTLMEIAPAVWNLQYLQSLETHARAIPAIASGIARLSNAQSSRIREKVARLTLSKERGSSGIDIGRLRDETEEEIKGRLWSLCQTKIQADPLAKKTTRNQSASSREEPTYDLVGLPLVSDGGIIQETEDSGQLGENAAQLFSFQPDINIPHHLQVEFPGEVEHETIYHHQPRPNTFFDIPEQTFGGDGALTHFPSWTALHTSYCDTWGGQAPQQLLLQYQSAGNGLAAHANGHLLMGPGDGFDTLAGGLQIDVHNSPFAMSPAGDSFDADSQHYHYDLEFLGGDIGNEDMEDGIADEYREEEEVWEDGDAYVYADGRGNCYTFDPFNPMPHEIEQPPESARHFAPFNYATFGEEYMLENCHHRGHLHQAQADEGDFEGYHEC